MKWVMAAAFLVLAIPAALGASPSADKPKSAGAQSAGDNRAMLCKAERERVGVQAFKANHGTNANKANAFGKCVSAKPKHEAKGEKDQKDEKDEKANDEKDSGAAAKACRAERASGAAAFAKKYGTNHNLRNAFGKCVSGRSKSD